MKKSLLPAAAALLLLSQGSVFADAPYPPDVQSRPSSLTRAEVRAQAIEAMRSGELRPSESAEPLRYPASTRIRAEVAAEARAATPQADGYSFGESNDDALVAAPARVQTQRVGAGPADLPR